MPFPAVATVFEYNGYSFDSSVRSHVEATPRWDEARRTIVAMEYRFHATFYIDGGLQDVRKSLEAVGGPLRYENGKGIGDFHVNVGGVWDVDFGPRPEFHAMDPIGNGQTLKCQWRCVAVIPYGIDGLGKTTNTLMAFNFDYSYEIDEQGWTTLTLSGYLEIPLTRADSNTKTLDDNADAYREKINYPSRPGYKRMRQEMRLDKAKKRLYFTIQDKEIPVALPDGTVLAEAAPHIHELEKDAFVTAYHTISGSVTAAPDKPKYHAWLQIRALVQSRVNQAVNSLFRNDKASVRPQGVQISEDMFSRRTDFSITYAVTGLKKLSQHLSASGLWTKISGADANWTFASWDASLKNTVNKNNHRGYANLTFKNTDDLIIDLLGTDPVVPTIPARTEIADRGGDDWISVGQPDANTSWALYELNLEVREDDRTIRHKPLGLSAGSQFVRGLAAMADVSVQPTYPPAMGGYAQLAPGMSMSASAGAASSTMPDIVQQVSAPSYTIYLTGQAVRVGFDIPIPDVKDMNNVTLVQRGKRVRKRTISQYELIPTYFARWAIEYICPTDPTKIGYEPNPRLGT